MTQVRKVKNKTGVLLYGDSERDADLLYLGKLFVPDSFLACQVEGKRRVCFLNQLEYARGVKESDFDVVYSLEDSLIETSRLFRKQKVGLVDLVKYLAHVEGIKEFVVPERFPAGLYADLRRARVAVSIVDGAIFPKRAVKNEAEAALIREGNKASEAGFAVVEEILRASKVKGRTVYYKGKALTAEYLKYRIEVACLERGAVSSHTIVACGDQGCDPHCRGSGPIYANELIVVDIFPRVTHTGYYGDMTRTFLQGKANDGQKKIVHTVLEAQKSAIALLKAGVSGKKVHEAVVQYFEKAGYKTGVIDGVPQGFIHSTGHGLGLDVHEEPRLGKTGGKLKAGNVVTVEPGLYYPGLGACRIEDVVWVKKAGIELLSDFHYNWSII